MGPKRRSNIAAENLHVRKRRSASGGTRRRKTREVIGSSKTITAETNWEENLFGNTLGKEPYMSKFDLSGAAIDKKQKQLSEETIRNHKDAFYTKRDQ
uniref:Uncharacterized protein n=1 Tax=Caenorhabditis japonica TaxID=281687 RepID=A0A8R1DET4_CAEJA